MPEASPRKRPEDQGVLGKGKPRRRVLNVRLLVGTVVALAVLAPAAWLWHRHQMGRIAETNWAEAESLEAAGEHAQAAVQWHRYLAIRPDDVEARIHLARSLAKAVVSARDGARIVQAINLLYEAAGLASEEEQTEIRKQLAEALLLSGRNTEALKQADLVLKADRLDKDGTRLRSLALFNLADSGTPSEQQPDGTALATVLDEALRLQPGNTDLALRLADIYRNREDRLGDAEKQLTQEQRNEKADGVIDQMVRAASQIANVRVARYIYNRRYGRPDAESDLQKAIECEPDHVEAHLLAGDAALTEGNRLRQGSASDQAAAKAKYQEARQHYRHILDSSKTADSVAYLRLGLVLVAEGNTKDALATWQEGLAKLSEAQPNPGMEFELNRCVTGLLLDLQRFEEAQKTLDALDQSINRVTRSVPSENQRAAGQKLTQARDFLQARLFMGKRQPVEAAPLLERLTTEPWAGPAEELLAWRLLAVCRAGLNRPKEAAEAYEKVLAAQPKWPEIRLAAAGARRRAGDVQAAIGHFEQLLKDTPEGSVYQSPDTWLALAALRFQSQWTQSQEKRDWGPFETALQNAKRTDILRPLRKPWEVPLLEAGYLAFRGVERGKQAEGIDAAVAILRKAETQFADQPEFLAALVAEYERLGRREDADRALATCVKRMPNPAFACSIRANLHLLRKEWDEARRTLQEGLKTLPPAAHPQVEFTLINLELARSVITEKQAAERLEAVRAKAPNNLVLLTRLADLALRSQDLKALERYEPELARLEGPFGAFYQYCRGQRLLSEAAQGKTDRLAEVERLVTDLRQRYPAWDRTHVLAGAWCETRGQPREAIAEYEEAIRRGARMLVVYERLVRLLRQTQQLDKARQYVADARMRAPSSDESREWSGMAIEMAWQQGELVTALEEARRGVKARPDDMLARIWLGEMLEANQTFDEAEKELQEAIRLSPTDATAREALWRFYLRRSSWDQAHKALQDYADNVPLTNAKRELLLAAGHEALSGFPANEKREEDRKAALKCFAEASRLAPDDAGSVLGLVRMRMGEDPKEAERLLEEFLQRVPDSRPAQRLLALLLASRGGQQEWARAEAMLSEIGEDEDAEGGDRRLWAQVLLRRGGRENVERAQRIMRKLVDDAKAPRPSDRQLLAQLYDLGGKPEQARQQLAMLIDPSDPNPVHIGVYADLLLRQGELDEAARQIERLEQLAANPPGAVALRARLLARQGHPEAIEPLVEAAAAKLLKKVAEEKEPDLRKRKEIALVSQIGGVYTEVGVLAPAERWYRRLLELTPAGYVVLAPVFAREGKMREAIELCTKAAEADSSPRPALALVGVLTAGKPTEDDFKLSEPVLAKAQATHKDEPLLLLQLGTVRILQGRIDEAVKLHEQVLDKEPKSVVAMNNLASILAEIPERRKKAAEYIEKATEIAGPQAMLLDTKAWIALLDGKPQTAVPLLEEVTASANSDPRFDLHLAGAYDRVGKPAEAKKALKKARDGHVESLVLTTMERKLLDELQKKHGS